MPTQPTSNHLGVSSNFFHNVNNEITGSEMSEILSDSETQNSTTNSTMNNTFLYDVSSEKNESEVSVIPCDTEIHELMLDSDTENDFFRMVSDETDESEVSINTARSEADDSSIRAALRFWCQIPLSNNPNETREQFGLVTLPRY